MQHVLITVIKITVKWKGNKWGWGGGGSGKVKEKKGGGGEKRDLSVTASLRATSLWSSCLGNIHMQHSFLIITGGDAWCVQHRQARVLAALCIHCRCWFYICIFFFFTMAVIYEKQNPSLQIQYNRAQKENFNMGHFGKIQLVDPVFSSCGPT